MKRTLSTAIRILRRRGLLWPLSLASSAVTNLVHGLPRGLIVEPSSGCTGNCQGCNVPGNPENLSPEKFLRLLEERPAKAVTIHFAGKHSDPLSSPCLPDLVRIAGKHSPMVSVSTIGLGLKEGWENLPVDRWIVSIPAATRESWLKLRGNERFEEAKANLRRLVAADRSMVEMVLTLWKPSENDGPAFKDMVRELGIVHSKTVFGRFDPQGYHMGRLDNLALDLPDCPYLMVEGVLKLKKEPAGCPLSGTLFLDASGLFHPCPFTGVSAEETADLEGEKRKRSFPACRYCP